MEKEHLRICLPLIITFALAVPPREAAAQVDSANTTLRTSQVAPEWRPRSREAHQTEWQSVRSFTNPVTRHVRSVTNSYIELATGLNYRDPSTGRWQPSDQAFRITERGAESTAGQHTVLLAPDIGTLGSVTVRKGDLTMQLHPLCVAYYDPVDGRSVRLAEITNAIGYLVSSNEVVYSNCFNGLRASIRIRNSRAGIEQDLLIHAQPEFTPADFGFSRLTRLELFSELVGDSPMPQVSTRVICPERPPDGVTRLREENFTDSTLNFGPMEMNAGRAFSNDRRDALSRTGGRMDSGPVGKSFLIIDGRRILIEAVPVRHIEEDLNDLPRTGADGGLTNAAVTPFPRQGEMAGVAELKKGDVASASGRPLASSFPVGKAGVARGRMNELGELRGAKGEGIRSLPPKLLALNTSLGQKIQTAASPSPLRGQRAGVKSQTNNPRPSDSELALVLDFQLVGSGGPSNGVFRGDMTYRVSGEVWLSSAVTFEGGTVVKFNERNDAGNPAYAILYVNGPVSCKTDTYHPAVFTSVYDNSVGEFISVQANPTYFYQALAINNYTTTTLSNIQVRYAQYAIHTGNLLLNLRHAQFAHCDTVFYPEWATWKMGNVLVYDSGDVFSSGSYYNVQATHITVNNCSRSLLTTSPSGNPAGCQVAFYNHILANIASLGTLPADRRNITGNDLLTGNNIFQSVGGGLHYLPSTSSLRDTALTPISSTDFPGLQAELQKMTTSGPQTLSGELVTSLTLARAVQRDNNALDRGYHYPAMDWQICRLNVMGGPLVVTNGAVVGLSRGGVSESYCLHLAGTELRSEGSPLYFNRFFPAAAVQEDPPNLTSLGPVPLFTDDPAGTFVPKASFRFSEINGLGGATDLNRGDNYLFDYEISHSRLNAMRCIITLYGNMGRTLGWTNNLFKGGSVSLSCSQPAYVNLYNNLFLKANLYLYSDANGVWAVKDSIFDNTAVTVSGMSVTGFHFTYNAYVPTIPAYGMGGTAYPSLTYSSGPLGEFYLPSGSPLINAGSQAAAAAGMYHFTTQTSQLKEGQDNGAPIPYQVDIGLHYVALSTLNKPLDSDGDGIPDYLEDRNGSGTVDSGWQSYDSPNGLAAGSGLQVFTPLE